MALVQTNNVLEHLAEEFRDNPLIRALIQVIPGAAVFDAALMPVIKKMMADRLRVFFDELSAGKIELTEELIQNEDFLHCYFATAKAALNTRRREKIKLFGRLLTTATQENTINQIDEYDEMQALVDELSYREIVILFLLEKCNVTMEIVINSDPDGKHDTLRNQFVAEACPLLNSSKDELQNMLTRLQRSGLYTDVRTINGYSAIGGLTPRFAKFRDTLRVKYGDELIHWPPRD